MELLTSAQMRKIEQEAIQGGATTGLALMERAGAGVVDAIFKRWPEYRDTDADRRAIVLCGPGNNGGDGFVIARLLAERGWAVTAYLYGNAEDMPKDARTNHDAWPAIGAVLPWDDAAIETLLNAGDHDVVIDALFGTGMTRAMPEDTYQMWRGFVPEVVVTPETARRQRYVAVDLPSGLCADSGANFGAPAVDLTVTFHAPKRGHYLMHNSHMDGGPGLCGALEVVDIGLPHQPQSDVALITGPVDGLDKSLGQNKFSNGHAVVLSGPPGKGGAARLAARGALRIGAGLVTVGCPQRAVFEHSAQLNAIMVRGLDGAFGLAEMLEDARINALCLGPGLGLTGTTGELVRHGLAAKRATVLDADALSRFERTPDSLFEMLHEECVLTPHAGEFRRLFPDIHQRLTEEPETGPAYSKIDATRDAAARAGCTIVFKGPDTVIATQSGQCAVHAAVYDRAAPWLATAGSGDVLAGFITGLMARGITPFDAACTAAWMHVECALSFGPGLIAEDLTEAVPQVLRQIFAAKG